MILKELDPFNGTEPFELAGRRAEEQMAFYLRRQFGDMDDVYVINGLRLERNGDACQIDHLLVHPFGFTVIESKSVTTEVSIDDKGNWSRLVEGTWKGMPSPINQAKLQVILLKAVLADFAPTVLKRIFGLQIQFGGLQYDTYAAVSDNGIIHWPPSEKYDTICKADGVAALIKKRIEYHKSWTGLSGLTKALLKPHRPEGGTLRYSEEVMLKVAEHLIASHAPMATPKPKQKVQQQLTSEVLVLPDNTPPNPTLASTSACRDCTAPLSPRVMDFCRAYPHRFAGNLYCMKCQPKY